MYLYIIFLAAIVTTAVAETIVINVGQSGFTFSPNSVTANVGDVLQFHFFNSLHTVVQGDFSTPCQMGSLQGSGFDSGPTSSGEVFQVTVQNTAPMWYYCSTPSHCQGGMVGVINPPSSGNSLATYQANAAGTSSSQSVGIVQGGVVVPAGADSGSSSGPSPSSTKAAIPPASVSSSTPAPTSPIPSSSTPGSSLVASSKPGSPQNPGSSSVVGVTSVSVPTLPESTSNSNISPATLSAPTTPTYLTTSRGGSLTEMTGKTTLFSVVFALGVVAVLIT